MALVRLNKSWTLQVLGSYHKMLESALTHPASSSLLRTSMVMCIYLNLKYLLSNSSQLDKGRTSIENNSLKT